MFTDEYQFEFPQVFRKYFSRKYQYTSEYPELDDLHIIGGLVCSVMLIALCCAFGAEYNSTVFYGLFALPLTWALGAYLMAALSTVMLTGVVSALGMALFQLFGI